MAINRRIFTYQNGRQVFVMPNGYGRRVNYHMWAGGGGAGGDSGALTGGNGAAGTYITGTFNADPGDRIEVIVGGGGQEGRSLDSNKKIYSCTVEGTGSSGVGPTASYGFVNDPTKAIYPQYNDPLNTRTFDKWNSFMNAWAVSNLPSNRAGTEEVTNTIYFPEAGDYKLQIAADNQVTWSIGDFTTTTKDNFASGPFERTIRVAGPGTAELRYTLTNFGGSSGNPAGCAAVITRSPPSYMGGGGVETYPGKASMKNVIWSTRFGPNVDVTNRVPLLYAPVVDFYQPQSDYNWSGVPEVGLCFISDNSTWTQAELERLNLNFNKIISISYPVTITGTGNIDQVCATGYYTFKRGQTWELARYNWLGNPTRNNNMTGRGTGTPSNWTERQWFNDGANNRSKNKEFAKWQLPVPPADTLYIVGYADGVIYNSPSQRGSDNVTWTVNSTVSQFYAGGSGGKSATNESSKKFNYYGGYGGQIGTNQTSGGGGGGGGSSYIAVEKATQTTIPNPDNDRLIANWFNDIQTSTWYDELRKPSGINLTFLAGASAAIMPGRSPQLRSLLVNGTTTSNASCANLGALNISGLDASNKPKPFTIEAWVRATGPGVNPDGYGGEIINKDFEYEIARTANGRIIFAVDWGQGINNAYPGSGWIFTNYFLPVNTSALISLVFFDNDAILYVDAVKKWQASVNGFSSSGTGAINSYSVPRYKPRSLTYKLFVGSRTSLNQNWVGYIGDVRLWDHARSQQQIYDHMFGITYTRTSVTYQKSRVGVAIAGGGGGGGGAGFKGNGNNGSNEYVIAPQPNSNSIGAGGVGSSAYNSGGGGGGGGGGCDGAIGGKAATSGVGSGGDGGYTGGSQVLVQNLDPPTADFVMVGRGGDGGPSGGGGGAGALMEGTIKLRKYQYIQVGGTDDAKFEGGVSAIWFDEKAYVAAGPGGRGGSVGASWAKNGNGQAGGCQSDNTNTNTFNGSGGGAGTGSSKSTATGGPGKESPSKVNASIQSKSYQNSGGNSAGGPSWSPGGGGGAGGNGLAGIAGIVGGTGARGGDGGPGRIMPLGKTGRSYTLAGGGGGASGYYQPGPYAGQGQAGGGDGATGSGPEIEFTKAQLYTIWVPRGVTSMNFEGVGAGGGGGTDSVRGAGGGGSGASLARTSYVVTPGQQIDIIVGPGGASGTPGGNTRIKFYAKGSVPESNVTLQGGSTGANTGTTPLGGNGGSPNGQTGGNGGQGDSPNFQSGSGASSPYGEGGSAVTVTNKTEKPGAGGRGAGGGGGRNGVPGGRGGDGYVSVSWAGSAPIDAQPNTGSGGGGDFGGNGAGGSGFVAIAYPGAPIYTHLVDRRPVPPIQQNGYTIHEFRTSGELVFEPESPEGAFYRGSDVTPAGTDKPFYIPGVAYGGVGNNNTDVFPVRSSSYNDFLNTYGVWNGDPASSTFDRTYSVYIAKEASYQIQAAADNGAQVFIDGGIVIDMTPANRDNGSYWQKNTATNVKKLSVGMHTLKISATNLNLQGAFGMTIVEAGTQNFAFNSRRPPVPSGSPQGGDGLCVLEFDGGEGTAKIKENNAWKQIIGQWVKIDGAWKKIIGSATKVNGTWQSLFGAAPIAVSIDPNNFGGPPAPSIPVAPQPEPDTGGGGGGGGCKIICTVLHDLGLLSDQIYAADEQFGELLRSTDPAAYYGYVKWASVVVDWMEGSGPQCMFWIRDPEQRSRKQREMAIRWAHRIATPWAQHMAYKMGAAPEDSRAGRWIMNTGLAISRAIGKVTGTKEPSKSVTLGYAMWTVFAVFWLLAGVKGQ
jgi:hypothetical protein